MAKIVAAARTIAEKLRPYEGEPRGTPAGHYYVVRGTNRRTNRREYAFGQLPDTLLSNEEHGVYFHHDKLPEKTRNELARELRDSGFKIDFSVLGREVSAVWHPDPETIRQLATALRLRHNITVTIPKEVPVRRLAQLIVSGLKPHSNAIHAERYKSDGTLREYTKAFLGG